MIKKVPSIGVVCMLVIVGFVGFIHFRSGNARGTNVDGIVYDGSGGPWTLMGSPYIVTGDVTVPAGETLTIEPGVEVKFDGYYSIYVDGTLKAIGTETWRINITSNIVPSDWRNIQINSLGNAEIKYCNISYAFTGIGLYSSNNNITKNIFWNNNYGVVVFGSSFNNIIYNNFHSNDGPCIGLNPTSSNNIIANNNISNSDYALFIRECSDNTITNNNIMNNGRGIYIEYSSNITITGNNFINDGIYFNGDQLSHFNSHNITDDNIINGKLLIYYKDSSNINIDSIPVGQVILANCSNIEVRGLQIDNVDGGIVVSYSNDIMVASNNISLNDMEGIRLIESSNSTISGNNVSNNGFGIVLRTSSNNIITNNNATSNNQYGIRGFSLSSNNNIMDNYVYNNYIGIGLEASSSNNTVISNDISNNDYGIDLVFSPSENVIKWNTISSNNEYGIYFSSAANNNIIGNNNISNGDYGIYIISSASNIITDNIISNNSHGCYLQESSNNVLTNNNISNNGNGIYLYYSFENNAVISNTIFSNSNNGIYIKGTSNNNITGNYISGNDNGINISQFSNNALVRNNSITNNNYGVYIEGMTFNNLIHHNNIMNNTIQAIDITNNGNQWDNGYPSGGNYWSDFDEPGEGAYDDYNGSNQDILGSDGIVDNGTVGGGGTNPYEIDSDSQDNYPLIEPSDNFMFLYEGWNLISLPLVQSDTNVGAVLTSISGSYKTVQWYDTTDSDDPWKHHCTTKPQHLNDFDSIDHLIGFWIFITQPGGVLFEYYGVQPGLLPENIPLRTGWNMVGFPSRENKNRTVGLNNLTFGIEVDALFTFDAATQTWEAVGPGDDFELGRGYWVHAMQECVWEVPL